LDVVKPRQTCNHLQWCRHYWKICQQDICQAEHGKEASCDRNLDPKLKYFDEDEFLSSHVTDRPYSHLIGIANAFLQAPRTTTKKEHLDFLNYPLK